MLHSYWSARGVRLECGDRGAIEDTGRGRGRVNQPKVTIKIPRHLYDHIHELIKDSGFSSVTEFVVYVLRDVVYDGSRREGEFSPQEIDNIKRKLKSLGYL